jgi:hypothetical protein
MNKKPNESSEPIKTFEEASKVLPDETAKKLSAWTMEPKASTIEEIPIIKSVETPSIPTVVEKPKEVIPEQKNESESTVVPQTETESTNKKSTTINSQKKPTKDQRYQNQQAPRYRNNYTHSMQGKDYS